ncbi:MAG TPA: VCBS repeat-containing protein [Nannocystis sp.]|jgi:hypothetical protein
MRRILGVLCFTCVTACGDDMTDSLTGGMTGSAATTLDPTTTLPTSGVDGSGEETAADGSADGTADTGTNTEPPTTGPEPTSTTGTNGMTGTTDTTASTGTTSTTGTTGTTGAPAMCDPMPAFDPEIVPIDESCKVDLQEGTFNPVIEWKYGSTSFAGPAAVGQIVDTDASGALDDLDMPIILIYESSNVVALRGDGSGVAWQANGAYGGPGNGIALGDLEGDGWPEVITGGFSNLCALDGQTGVQKWCVGLAPPDIGSNGYNFPAIADMDADGLAEVTLGRVIVDSTGVVIAKGTLGKGGTPIYGAMSVPVDLDGDGQMELVTGNAAYDVDGNVVWQNGASDGLVAVADFDLDGEGEIVSTIGTGVLGMETDGTVVWGPLPYPGNLGAPAIDDLDGDGTPELLFAAQNSLVAMKWGGAVFWTAPISDNSGAAGPSLFDFEKDGYPEVLYADEVAIRFFSGLDGSVKFFSDQHKSGTILEYPVVADVDNDDEVEIVLGHHTATRQIGAVTVYGDADKTWPPGRKVWNQHAYSITNVGNLGEIPAVPQQNWPQYNSFRSADIGLPPGEFIELLAELLDACTDGCDGAAYIAARVRNAGNVEAPAGIPVTLRAGPGGPVLATLMTTAPIAPGATGEVLVFAVPASDLMGLAPEITVDDIGDGSGVIPECHEDNNVALGEPLVCR